MQVLRPGAQFPDRPLITTFYANLPDHRPHPGRPGRRRRRERHEWIAWVAMDQLAEFFARDTAHRPSEPRPDYGERPGLLAAVRRRRRQPAGRGRARHAAGGLRGLLHHQVVHASSPTSRSSTPLPGVRPPPAAPRDPPARGAAVATGQTDAPRRAGPRRRGHARPRRGRPRARAAGTGRAAARRRRPGWVALVARGGVLVALVLVIVVFGIARPDSFLTTNNLERDPAAGRGPGDPGDRADRPAGARGVRPLDRLDGRPRRRVGPRAHHPARGAPGRWPSSSPCCIGLLVGLVNGIFIAYLGRLLVRADPGDGRDPARGRVPVHQPADALQRDPAGLQGPRSERPRCSGSTSRSGWRCSSPSSPTSSWSRPRPAGGSTPSAATRTRPASPASR